MKTTNNRILSFQEIDKTSLSKVGGKGANLGELFKMEGIHVPEGFCITTDAFNSMIEETPLIQDLLNELALLTIENRDQIATQSADIRKVIEKTAIPADLQEAITRHLFKLGENDAYAVRSSATAEDLPTASFAGQQDTFLNVVGKEAIFRHISQCWASLFTERAVIYRMQNGFDHSTMQLAVIIQKMVFPQAAGIVFTADPVTSNRKILSIDASFGLGEALVAGLVNADNYTIRNGEIINKKIAVKKLKISALDRCGTKKQAIEPEQQHTQTLTDEQILQLERIGRKIEAYFGSPQDIEWCLADETFYMVQSRPITTLYPIPTIHDEENHVYLSVGHQQMMTDAMKPLGLSIHQLTSGRIMYEAGGRLFVDVAPQLATAAGRETLLNFLGKSDPLFKDALMTIVERGDFIKLLPDDPKEPKAAPAVDYQALNDYDSSIVAELIQRSQHDIKLLQQNIQTKIGAELFNFIAADIQQLRKCLFTPQSFGVIMTGMNAAIWINEKMHEWLGEKNAADTLAQSVPNNITSEMGLALLDLADVIRPYPAIINYLQQVNKADNFLNHLLQLEGGQEVQAAIQTYLDKYGMRCVGEIDITKTRWSEKPNILIPLIISNIKNFEPGESKRRFEKGRQEALKKEQELLAQLQQLPEGDEKIKETKRMIDLIRHLSGYREYPKYNIVNRYFIYKQALLQEAERLVQVGVIQKKEDIYYCTFEELHEIVNTRQVDNKLISNRKETFKLYKKLTPPRVITSEGEIINGRYKRENLPAGTIVGLGVSAGVIEGRARVILKMENAELEEGDILVTTFTDPSWTPLFVLVKGLITEVGGLMTHGAVIAREYGLPAVVGIANATQLIKDGQRIRVNGTEGYVEII